MGAHRRWNSGEPSTSAASFATSVLGRPSVVGVWRRDLGSAELRGEHGARLAPSLAVQQHGRAARSSAASGVPRSPATSAPGPRVTPGTPALRERQREVHPRQERARVHPRLGAVGVAGGRLRLGRGPRRSPPTSARQQHGAAGVGAWRPRRARRSTTNSYGFLILARRASGARTRATAKIVRSIARMSPPVSRNVGGHAVDQRRAAARRRRSGATSLVAMKRAVDGMPRQQVEDLLAVVARRRRLRSRVPSTVLSPRSCERRPEQEARRPRGDARSSSR